MTQRKLFLFIFISAICLFRVNHSANVLCMFTSFGKSHLVVFMAVANTLTERGHNVTVITTIPIPAQSESRKPFRHILLHQSPETMKKLSDNVSEIADYVDSKIRSMIGFILAVKTFTSIQWDALQQEQFQSFLKEENHFDLMLLGYFHNDYMVGVGARYKCPIAVISLGSPFGPISRMVGNPEETSYVQFPLFGRSQRMSFVERMVNFLWALVEPCIQIYVNRMMENLYNTLFVGDFYPKYLEVISNISLVLFNDHFTALPVRPLVPALIEIGGIQFKEKPDPLPPDFQIFLDASTNGAILFSVGKVNRGSSLKPEKLQIVLSVLNQLEQNVIFDWKGSESTPDNTSNVLFGRSLPLEDILAHRNVKLYITDGRAHAISAAQYHGIPMVGIPLYGEDPYNVEEMTNKGFGIYVDAQTFTEDSLKRDIIKVLESPYYTQKVKQFSTVYRDRPTTARETAAFWLEYVIRYQGAPHMQSSSVHMDFIERWNIDVIAVLLALCFTFIRLVELASVLVRILTRKTKRLKIYKKYKQI